MRPLCLVCGNVFFLDACLVILSKL